IGIMAIAVGLPALEFVAALGLLLDLRGSLGVISGLLILFMGVLGYGIWMGFDIDCGCFGPQDPEAEAFHSLRPALYRDFLMMAGAGYLYLWRYCRSAKPVRPADMIQRFKKKRGR
ncbi:MAG: DoxX family protein, partial [Deltaproteobacteria bacterium]|nr:DoxX family protein [Deltaproteobacteria bacterium]